MNQKLKVNVVVPREQKQIAPKQFVKSIAHLKKLIEARVMDDNIKALVFKKIEKYPEGALDYIWKNIDSFVHQCVIESSKKQQQQFNIQPQAQPIVTEEAKVEELDFNLEKNLMKEFDE